MTEKLIDIRQIGTVLGVTPRTIMRWVDDGLFPAPSFRAGHTVRWLPAVVKERIGDVAPLAVEVLPGDEVKS